MEDFLFAVFSWICKGIVVLMLIAGVLGFLSFCWVMITNGGRKWYYYNSSKPWKGGYWEPLLPGHPPYNDYRWNPDTCRFEHKITGQPLHPWETAQSHRSGAKDKKSVQEWDWDALGLPDEKPMAVQPVRRCPEWVRVLFEETPASLMQKRKRRKESGK